MFDLQANVIENSARSLQVPRWDAVASPLSSPNSSRSSCTTASDSDELARQVTQKILLKNI